LDFLPVRYPKQSQKINLILKKQKHQSKKYWKIRPWRKPKSNHPRRLKNEFRSKPSVDLPK